MNIVFRLIFALTTLSSPLFHTQETTANYSPASMVVNHDRVRTISIGSILDQGSRSGKEAKVAMEMAAHDFSSTSNQKVHLYFRNSQSKPGRAALAANDLIATHGAKAILGAHTSEEESAIAEAAQEATHDVPVFLSLADSIPTLPTFPFLLQASPSQHVQMKAIAKILQSCGLHEVTLIYENLPSISSHEFVVSHLSQAFQETGAKLSHIFALTTYTLNSLDEELNLLKEQKQKAFVIHATLDSGYLLYQNAKKLNMTGDGYVWMATNSITDLLYSVSPAKMSSMQGLIGTKTYFPENSPEFQDFRRKFRPKFRKKYADEEYAEPGILAAQAYDAMRALLHQTNTGDFFSRTAASDFWGLSGKFQFTNRKRTPAKVVEIVNVIGKSYQSGYWTEGLGFSKTTDEEAFYHTSMEILKTVLWPTQPWYTEKRRRVLVDRSEPIRVGVPGHSLFKQFVKVETDPITNETTSVDGFSIKVFEETMKLVSVNNSFTYKYFPFVGDYNHLVKQIALGEFDAVAGDVTILRARFEDADFTQPYTESGMVLVVPVRSRLPSRMWLFLKPFTKEMWGLIVAITIYNGFTVWLIERKETDVFRSGTVWHQIGIIFWLSFTTLFSLQGRKLHSNLSRMTIVVWLFVALIITQSYTASLASMLTAQRLEPTIKDVETLKKMNATVGYCKGSFLKSYLVTALGFPSANINKYGSTQAYAEALYSREIAGIFMLVPFANVFLSQYCKSFIKTGKTFKLGGFGFAFEKNFSLLPDINKAIMNITESGKLLELENRYINSEKCLDADSLSNEDASIGLNSFSILFALTGFTSTVSLAMYVINLLNSRPEHRNIFKLISIFIKKWRQQKRRSSGRVMDAENPNPPDAPHQESRQSFGRVIDPCPLDVPHQETRHSSGRVTDADNTTSPEDPHQEIRQSSSRFNHVNTDPRYPPHQERTIFSGRVSDAENHSNRQSSSRENDSKNHIDFPDNPHRETNNVRSLGEMLQMM